MNGGVSFQLFNYKMCRLSEGASGAFFFMCGNGELVVKTVQQHEARTLMKILDKYLKHLRTHPKTMLVRFLGLHSIKMSVTLFDIQLWHID